MFDIITNRNTTMPRRGLHGVWIRHADEDTDHFRWSLRPVFGFLMLACIQLVAVPGASAQIAGKVSGVVRDKTGSVIAGAAVAAINNTTGVKQTTKSDVQGSYSFPVLPVGQYEIEVTSDGFKPYRQTGLTIDINSAVVLDLTLQLGEQSQNITVSVTEEPVQVETTDTQLGEVLGSKQVAEIPLNGRSYTDLFSTQVGVSPITTSGAGKQHIRRRIWDGSGGRQRQYRPVFDQWPA